MRIIIMPILLKEVHVGLFSVNGLGLGGIP